MEITTTRTCITCGREFWGELDKLSIGEILWTPTKEQITKNPKLADSPLIGFMTPPYRFPLVDEHGQCFLCRRKGGKDGRGNN